MSLFKLIGGVVFNVAIYGGLLFLPAGTLDWWRAWVVLGLVFVGTVASTVSVFRVNKELLEERFKPPVQQGQPLADKIVVLLLIAGFVSVILFHSPRRFPISPNGQTWNSRFVSGVCPFCHGLLIMTLALVQNPFAAPVVKHQKERQQTVIDSGVYGAVRHPIYAGAVLMLSGLPLWLESYAAAMLASFPIAMRAVRISFVW